MIIEYSERFQGDYAALPQAIKKKVKKALRLFERNPRYPSLHTEKIDFEREIWSGRVDRNYRFTFHWVAGGVHLRKVGTHQHAYRSP